MSIQNSYVMILCVCARLQFKRNSPVEQPGSSLSLPALSDYAACYGCEGGD